MLIYLLCYDWMAVSVAIRHTNIVADLFLEVVLFTVPVTYVIQRVNVMTCNKK